ncbi:MAG: ArsR family transcriptional regulator [Anaerolineae bacterium]
MQQTRRDILDILRRRGQATVDELVEDLARRRGHITSVTVRHHLGRLQQEGLVTTAELRRKHSPGRPQHIYGLTPQADSYFPNNYQRLVAGLLGEMRRQLPAEGVNVILEGVAEQWASEMDLSDLPMQRRMDAVVEYLNGQGYSAYWEASDEGVILHTSNCPYHLVADGSISLCDMDMRLVASLVGAVPRRLSQMRAGDDTCSYLIPMHMPHSSG